MTKHCLEYTQDRGKRPSFPMKDELEGIYITGCDPYKEDTGTSLGTLTFVYGTDGKPAVQKMDAEVALKKRVLLDTKPVLLLKTE